MRGHVTGAKAGNTRAQYQLACCFRRIAGSDAEACIDEGEGYSCGYDYSYGHGYSSALFMDAQGCLTS